MSEIQGEDSRTYKPYEKTGIKEGDRIIKIEEKDITTTNELVETVNKSQGKEIVLTYIRDEEGEQHTSIKPVKTGKEEYKLRPMGKRHSSRSRNSNIL